MQDRGGGRCGNRAPIVCPIGCRFVDDDQDQDLGIGSRVRRQRNEPTYFVAEYVPVARSSFWAVPVLPNTRYPAIWA